RVELRGPGAQILVRRRKRPFREPELEARPVERLGGREIAAAEILDPLEVGARKLELRLRPLALGPRRGERRFGRVDGGTGFRLRPRIEKGRSARLDQCDDVADRKSTRLNSSHVKTSYAL